MMFSSYKIRITLHIILSFIQYLFIITISKIIPCELKLFSFDQNVIFLCFAHISLPLL